MLERGRVLGEFGMRRWGVRVEKSWGLSVVSIIVLVCCS